MDNGSQSVTLKKVYIIGFMISVCVVRAISKINVNESNVEL